MKPIILALTLLLALFSCTPNVTQDARIKSIAKAHLNTDTSDQRVSIVTLDAENDEIMLKAEGFNEGEHLALYVSNLTLNLMKVVEFVVNAEGEPISVPEGRPLSKYIMGGRNCIAGEPLYYMLESAERNQRYTVVHVPKPIECRWDDGAVATLTLVRSDRHGFILHGKGFIPNEEIEVTSYADVATVSIKIATEQGTFVQMIESNNSKTHGLASTVIKRLSTGEKQTLKYQWGRGI